MRYPWFHLLAECLLLGVLLLVCSLPVVTAFPALVAGCTVLRKQARGGPGVSPSSLLGALRTVLRSGPAVWLVPTGMLALLWLDAVALEAHGPGMGVPLVAASAIAAAVLLRCASGWREGTPWRVVAVTAFRAMPDQPLVLVLLAGAAVAIAALLAMSPVLVLVALGPLALAATAADAWRPLTLPHLGPSTKTAD
ncbi:hypothetical protein ACFCWG_06530 [Streptomyces sp. NPDC056390]|uniref:hypothetical protein n=1 Tax=Streptomyces sp. NPDC056390 TaxID=3345806 RepID=UPI0035D8C0B7